MRMVGACRSSAWLLGMVAGGGGDLGCECALRRVSDLKGSIKMRCGGTSSAQAC